MFMVTAVLSAVCLDRWWRGKKKALEIEFSAKRVPEVGMAKDGADQEPKDIWSKKTLKEFFVRTRSSAARNYC